MAERPEDSSYELLGQNAARPGGGLDARGAFTR